MALVLAALDATRRGRGSAVVISGEPGVGKTRFCEELATRARTQGMQVCLGRCVPEGRAPAMWPWSQVVRSVLDAIDDLPVSGADAAVILEAIPELRDALPASREPPEPVSFPPDRAVFRFFDRITALLQRTAERGPLLIVIDDVQWADELSVRLLEYAARELSWTPILLVVTCRPLEPMRDFIVGQALSQISRTEGSTIIALHGLSQREGLELWRALARRGLEGPGARSLHERTGGNPFFIRQTLMLEATGGAGSTRSTATSSVWGAIRRHLEVVTPQCRATLEIAAVVGQRFSLDIISRSAGIPPTEVSSQIEEALRAGIVRRDPGPAGTFAFEHDLIREALYEQVPSARRDRLHWRLGEVVYEGLGVDSSARVREAAHHYLAGFRADGSLETVVGLAMRAAQQAEARLGFEEAADFLERALHCCGSETPASQSHRDQVAIELARVSRHRGDPERAYALVDEVVASAQQRGDWDLLARAACEREDTGLLLGAGFLNDSETVLLLEQALAELPPRESSQRVRLLAHLARRLFYGRNIDRAIAMGEWAVALARAQGEPELEITALEGLYWALWEPPHAGERVELADRIISLARAARARQGEAAGRHLRMSALFELGEIGEMRLELERSRALATTPTWILDADRWLRDAPQTSIDLLHGELELADDRIQTGLASELGGPRRQDAILGGQLVLLRFLQGRMEEVEAITRSLPRRFGPGWDAALSLFCVETERWAEGRRLIESLAAYGFRPCSESIHWLMHLSLAAEVATRLEHRDAASVLYDLLKPHRDLHVTTRPGVGSWGPAARYLGLLSVCLGRLEEAQEYFSSARRACERMGAWPWLAHTEFDQSQLLRRRDHPGDKRRAETWQGSALERARQMGLTGLERRISRRRG